LFSFSGKNANAPTLAPVPAEDGDGKWHLYFGVMNLNRLPESIDELNQFLFTKQVRPLVLVHDQALCR
jgi:hypothetical protein